MLNNTEKLISLVLSKKEYYKIKETNTYNKVKNILFEKCDRDMTYVLNAVFQDMENDTTINSEKIVARFDTAGFPNGPTSKTDALRSCKEFYLQVFPDGNLNKFSTLIDLVCDLIESRYQVNQHSVLWQDRYTVRCFNDKISVPKEDIQHLKNMFQFVPSQQSKIDQIWFTLTSDHKDFKIWLLENIFYFMHTGDGTTLASLSEDERQKILSNGKGIPEYMVSIISAPLVFLNMINCDVADPMQDAYRNAGIVAGAVGSEALRLGYDICFKGCTSGLFWQGNEYQNKENFNKKLEEMCDRLYKIFGDKIAEHTNTDKRINFFPGFAFCIGKGLPLRKDVKYDKYKGYEYFASVKTKKPWSGVI